MQADDHIIKVIEEKHDALVVEIKKSRDLNTQEHSQIYTSAASSERVTEKLDEVLTAFQALGSIGNFIQKASWVILMIILFLGANYINIFK